MLRDTKIYFALLCIGALVLINFQNAAEASFENKIFVKNHADSDKLLNFSKVQNLEKTKLMDKSKARRHFSCDSYGKGHRDCRFSNPYVDVAGKGTLVLLFQAWSRFATMYKVQYWLVHGTLLGWHWGHTVMDFDEDLDLAVTLDTMHRVMLSLNGTVFEGQYLLDINPTYIKRKVESQNIIDCMFIDILSGGKIDITAFSTIFPPEYKDQDTMIQASDQWRYHISDIFPLNVSVLDGIKTYVPKNAKKLLVKEYKKESLVNTNFKGYKFNGVHWVKTPAKETACKPLDAQDLYVNASRFFIPWETRERLRLATASDDTELNIEIESQLNSLDIDNSISTSTGYNNILNVAEFNIQRGTHWCKAVELIRKGETTKDADIIFINEADWGMSRSGNGHIARLMAKELGMNYVWGIEFLELTPGNKEETLQAQKAADCPKTWRGSGFTGKQNGLGYTGNAIFSKWPLRKVSLARFPGSAKLFHAGRKNWITAYGYEKRLGSRMALYASIDIPGYDIVHVGCFHLQPTWDTGENWEVVGKQTAKMIREHQDKIDPMRTKTFVIGGDGWGTKWCQDEAGMSILNPFAGGDWICARNFKDKRDYEVVEAKGVANHSVIGIRLTLE